MYNWITFSRDGRWVSSRGGETHRIGIASMVDDCFNVIIVLFLLTALWKFLLRTLFCWCNTTPFKTGQCVSRFWCMFVCEMSALIIYLSMYTFENTQTYEKVTRETHTHREGERERSQTHIHTIEQQNGALYLSIPLSVCVFLVSRYTLRCIGRSRIK